MGRERPHEEPLQVQKEEATTQRAETREGVRGVATKGSRWGAEHDEEVLWVALEWLLWGRSPGTH